MTMADTNNLPKLQKLLVMMPGDGVINIRLEKGVPVFRASGAVQERIQSLLYKQQAGDLTLTDSEELDRYEEVDDYLSHLNRVVRNLLQSEKYRQIPSQNPSFQGIFESVNFLVNSRGEQTAIQMDMSTWQALSQLLEDIEDVAEIEQARQEKADLFDWDSVIAEHQAKSTPSSDV